MNLGDLFDKYGSDKATQGEGHRYHEVYETLIPRDTAMLVELGLGGSGFNGAWGSARAWLDWLDGGQFIGVDIEEPPADLCSRFAYYKCDLGDVPSLMALAEAIQGCDVIIDDASHRGDQQRLAFAVLWPALKPDGLYIVEDLHVPGSAAEMKDYSICEQVISGKAAVLRKGR